MRFLISLILTFFYFLSGTCFASEDILDNEPFHITKVEVLESKTSINKWNSVKIHWTLNSIYHAYLDRFQIQSKDPDNYEVRWNGVDEVVDFVDPISGKKKQGVKNHGVITAEYLVKKTNKSGLMKIAAELTYQACSKNHCLLPVKVPVSWDTEVAAANSASIQLFSYDLGPNSILLWILIFAAGFLTSLTPCVFPLIPITLTVLGTRHAHHRFHNRVALSFSYVLGIALTYAFLGVLAASTGALFGGFLGHPLVAAALIGLFLLNALSSLDWIVLQTPHFLTRRLHLHKTQDGYLGAFLSGLIAGVVASPCVGPVLAGVLTFVAQTQNLLLGFGLLFTFAMGLGLLFLLLGIFADIQKYMPKSGPWMEAIKYIFAFSFFGIAIFYSQPWISHSTTWRLTGLALIISLWSKDRVRHWIHSKGLKKAPAILKTGIVLLAGALFVGVPPTQWLKKDLMTLASEEDIQWQTYSESELASAKSAKLPVIIDIYADWCAACKELERLTFKDPLIKNYKNKIRFLKFDATQETPEFKLLRERYSIVGLPNVIFIDSSGEWQKELTLNGFEEADKFNLRIQKLK